MFYFFQLIYFIIKTNYFYLFCHSCNYILSFEVKGYLKVFHLISNKIVHAISCVYFG